MTPLNILYQDEYLVAVHKPTGLLVHRSALARGETEFLLQRLRDQIGKRVYPVHRLDRPTSGVMVFALSSTVAGLLSEAFSERQVEKRYLAVVRGKAPES
ncbi:MAG: pseudouridine synthase, partial [Halomonas sp.]|nr:pseudouridine synthase [Halomonas sp.]